jgi:hypothetical protein
MFIFYPTLYDMTMLALASYIQIRLERRYPVYPDNILQGITVMRVSMKVLRVCMHPSHQEINYFGHIAACNSGSFSHYVTYRFGSNFENRVLTWVPSLTSSGLPGS